ncbi:hypothetical protein QKU48_gp1310 [Fadolivirus algeromassiliense]|jgi:hypothetical protein|uniref:Uncharacterized protein n=1 Tax=Fadolivirus FV1/VV64 TaxID=3070911 RepID=A0A7D3UQW5_9VIRU|nr:hypothetical protein QKU48_gp1310 [Fadolivirus algeromassiliense]QKF94768.1 hypothetical protein Fadolivirus_1_1310 [Fadolivirus FV1/VV64]
MNSESISFCIVAAIFVGASVYTMLTCKSCSPFVEYEQSLNQEQKQIYQNVVNERQKIYLTGLVVGTVLALLYLYGSNLELSPLKHSCIFVGIALATQYLYYMLYPKSVHMVTLMESQDQLKKWNAVYKHMQYRYHVGMVLGLVGYFLFSYGVKKQ